MLHRLVPFFLAVGLATMASAQTIAEDDAGTTPIRTEADSRPTAGGQPVPSLTADHAKFKNCAGLLRRHRM